MQSRDISGAEPIDAAVFIALANSKPNPAARLTKRIQFDVQPD